MTSPLSSSFALAASGNTSGNVGSRWNDNSGSSEGSRSRPNGATQTFRRTSTNTLRDFSQSGSANLTAGVYVPPHLSGNSQTVNMRNGVTAESRYSKDQLLGIYQDQKASGGLSKNLAHLFSGSWDPLSSRNGESSPWSKHEGKESSTGPEVCWDHEASGNPLGLIEMSEEEKNLFSSSVNSPLKLQQGNSKEGTSSTGAGGRKASLTGPFSGSSIGSGRPSGRRRETSDSFPANGPLSPTNTKSSFFRDDPSASTPPPAILRRRTDFKDETSQQLESNDDEATSQQQSGESNAPFASLKRSTTGPLTSAFGGASSAPWSAAPQTSAFGPMGNFGSFTVGTSATQDSEKRPGFGSGRSASRFKDLLAKTASEETPATVKEKISLGNLTKLPEDENEIVSGVMPDNLKTRPNRSETNPYEDAPFHPGAAGNHGLEQLGFSSFSGVSTIGSGESTRKERGPDLGYQRTPHGRYPSQEPMSPTNTNPYQSPPGNKGEEEEGDTSEPPSGTAAFASIRRSMMSSSEDRSQTSSTGNLRGTSGTSPWPSSGMTSGTPARDRNAIPATFGDSIFSPMSELQSPGLGGFGSGNFFGAGTTSSIGRTSKLSGLFPPAMQEQMHIDHTRGDSGHIGLGFEPKLESYSSRDPFDGPARGRDDPLYRSSLYDDPSGNRDQESSPAPFNAPGPFNQASPSAPTNIPVSGTGGGSMLPGANEASAAPSHGLSQSSGSSSSNQLPAAQQRQMVMPDRMRWIYRDPQGNTQGPFSGLEMHDWFKAGFFTAELQVKKLEDADFEPLAQLVRRIGNSREPFLVPQIGVPHGPPPATQGNHWASPTGPGAGAQPPFASSFPSFGTTLTAEQQNALERRKQEEQFLMARQKEHLAQQQLLMKQMQLQNGPHGLHSLQHHSSAHSLHSQPSFSSITSPSAYQPSPMPGPIQPSQHGPGFADNMARHPPMSSMATQPHGRDDELHKIVDRLSFNQRPGFPPGGQPSAPQAQDNVSAILQERARLQVEQQQSDIRGHREAFLGPGGQNERLAEFHALRSQQDFGQSGESALQQPIGAPQRAYEEQQAYQTQPASFGIIGQAEGRESLDQQPEVLSLAQQVQRAAASHSQNSKESQAVIPPPVSISPLPAPAAQRNRQNVADTLAAESRSATQTPAETPSASIAPWAEKSADMPKGPSLKEIQEAEARKAAEQEEIAAAARRAQAEQDRLSQPPPPAPGLPATSTWGNTVSPSTPLGPVGSVWTKAITGKPSVSQTNGPPKKTLAQIQKEEESRKQRATAASTTATALQPSAATPASHNKRYAELASKNVPAATATASNAWTTVGAGGKPKPPATVVATPQTTNRTPSTGATATKARPVLQTTRSSTVANPSKATEEFTKWAKGALAKGLNNNIVVEDFVQSLLALPSEIEIISDSVYANSQTLDGRRFAEEFVRRRKLADKGIVDPANNPVSSTASTDNKASGGWSEVAKKGPVVKEENNFKVVSKKKGKR